LIKNFSGNRGCNIWRKELGYGVNNARHVSAYLPEFLINKESLTIPCYIDKGLLYIAFAYFVTFNPLG
jgi:hypothetical protein